GNIREIESTLERAVLICEGETVRPEDLPMAIREYVGLQNDRDAFDNMRDFFDPIKNKTVLPLEQIKQLAVHHALQACGGNISEASGKLDISRSTMYRLLEIYHIQSQNGLAILPEKAPAAVEA